MTTNMKLPFQLEVLPDESFLGFLGRVSARNMLPSVEVLYELLGIKAKGLLEKLQNARRNLPEISRILGISPEVLVRNLPTPLSGDPATFLIGDLALKEHNFARKYRRVSPGALRLSEHHRASWLLGDLGFCRETWEVLIDQCPQEHCRAPLSWSPRAGIHLCDRCGYDLRAAQAEEIRVEDRAVLQFVADLASSDELYVKRALMQVHPSMRHLNRGVLLQLVNLFGRVILALQGDTNTKKYKGVTGYPWLAVAGGRLLRGYPSSILDIVETCHEAVMPDFFVRLRWLAKSGLSKATAEFVNQMILDLRPVARSNLKGLALVRQNQEKLTLREAAELLKIENAAVRRLTREGLLQPEHVRGAERQVDWFDRQEVQNLAESMQDRITTEGIHAAQNLPLTAVEQMVALNRLRWHPSRAVDIAYKGRCLKESEFRHFLDQLGEHLQSPQPDRISLLECFAMMGPVTKPWGAILNLAMQKALPGGLAQIDPKYGFRPSNLTLDRSIAAAIATGAAPWELVPEPKREFCTLMEAEERLACNARDIEELIKLRVLKRIGNAQAGLHRDTVLEAAKTFISAREIAARLGIQSKSIGAWSRHWRVPRSNGMPLWRRDEVEIFLPPIRYGGGEAITKVSKSERVEPIPEDAEPVRKVA